MYDAGPTDVASKSYNLGQIKVAASPITCLCTCMDHSVHNMWGSMLGLNLASPVFGATPHMPDLSLDGAGLVVEQLRGILRLSQRQEEG